MYVTLCTVSTTHSKIKANNYFTEYDEEFSVQSTTLNFNYCTSELFGANYELFKIWLTDSVSH